MATISSVKTERQPSPAGDPSHTVVRDAGEIDQKNQDAHVPGPDLRTEQAIRAYELSYRRLFEAARDGILILDVDAGRISDVNPFLIAMLDFSHGEMIGKTIGELCPFKDMELNQAMLERLQMDGYVRYENLPLQTRDGRKIAVEFVSNVYPAGDRNVIQCNVRDITARKQGVLVVDDNATNRKLLLATLGAEGFTVFEAADGVAALGVLERERIDSIISDILMPRMDGYRLCYEVRRSKRFENIPFIIYTSTYTSPSDEKFALELGGDRFVCKSASAKESLALLHEMKPHPKSASRVPLEELTMVKEYSERLVPKLEENNAELLRQTEQLHESKERFRQLAENISEVFWMSDLQNTKTLYVSPAYEEIWGRTCESRYAAPGSWLAAIHPDDRARVIETLARQSEAGRYDHIYRIIRPDDSIRWIHDRGFPVRNDRGEIYRHVGIAEDITDHKHTEETLRESEEVFHRLSESSPLGIMLMDGQGACTYANPHSRAIFAVPALESMGDGWARFIHKEERCEVLRQWFAAAREGREYSQELRLQLADGSIRYVHMRSSKMFSDTGAARGHVVTVEDVTERRQATNALNHSNEQLRALAARLQEVREEESLRMAREIHDVLGQQLTSLNIDLVWLRKRVMKKPDALDRSKLRQRIKSMESLLKSSIKSVQRIASDLRPGIIDDLGLAATLEWQAEEFEKRTDIRCEWKHKAQNVALGADQATALFRIFQETLTNIARHAHARRVTLDLQQAGGSLVLEIADDGKGFDEEMLSDRKSLGLLGMRERAMFIGASLETSSTPGQGTAVTVELPLTAIRGEKNGKNSHEQGPT